MNHTEYEKIHTIDLTGDPDPETTLERLIEAVKRAYCGQYRDETVRALTDCRTRIDALNREFLI